MIDPGLMDPGLMDQALWVVGRGSGMTALALFTVTVALGIVTRSGRPLPGLPRFAVQDLHRNAALLATAYLMCHIGLLWMDPYAKLRMLDIVVPFAGDRRPLWLGLGTLAVDLLIAILLTALLRHRIGPRPFRLVHWAVYPMWALALAHALGNGTDSTQPWFVAFIGACALTVSVAAVARVRTGFVEYTDRRVRP